MAPECPHKASAANHAIRLPNDFDRRVRTAADHVVAARRTRNELPVLYLGRPVRGDAMLLNDASGSASAG